MLVISDLSVRHGKLHIVAVIIGVFLAMLNMNK